MLMADSIIEVVPTQPDQNFFRTLVDLIHDLNLLVPLKDVVLVDTDLINPYKWWVIPGPVDFQKIVELSTDQYGLAVDWDVSCLAWLTQLIR